MRPLKKHEGHFMYAVIRTGAKQYRVQPGDKIEVELLDGEKGKEIALDDVLLVADGDKVLVGKPTVAGARVTAEVLDADKKAAMKVRARALLRNIVVELGTVKGGGFALRMAGDQTMPAKRVRKPKTAGNPAPRFPRCSRNWRCGPSPAGG